MAIPVVIGPATIGTILVLGSELKTLPEKMASLGSMALAAAVLWLMLYLSTTVERIIGKRGLGILSKITGLILASLAAQMMLTGLRNALFTGENRMGGGESARVLERETEVEK